MQEDGDENEKMRQNELLWPTQSKESRRARVRGLEGKSPSQKVQCPFCGATCWAGRARCDLCGRPLGGGRTNNPNNPSPGAPETTPETSEEQRCEHCGITLLPDSKYCHECGRRLQHSPKASVAEFYGEPVEFHERGVWVTRSRLVVGKRQYALNQISQVEIEIKPLAIRLLPALLVVFLIATAIWIVLYGWQSQHLWVVLIGVAVILFALLGGYRSTAPHHALTLRIGETMEEVLASADAEFVSRVAKAILHAKDSKGS